MSIGSIYHSLISGKENYIRYRTKIAISLIEYFGYPQSLILILA